MVRLYQAAEMQLQNGGCMEICDALTTDRNVSVYQSGSMPVTLCTRRIGPVAADR